MSVRDPVVCVVGAGPAGLTLAQLLQRAGISVVVLERQLADGLGVRAKAGMIEYRTVELLRAHGLAETILGRGTRIGSCEFWADGEAFALDYAALCGGRGHYIYPQHELLSDWAEGFRAVGGDLRFGVEATSVEQDADGALVRAEVASTGEALTIECEAAACCDGAASGFAEGIKESSVAYPFRWLALIAAVPPLIEGTIYGLHRRGFAGQMHRSPTMTRFMLQVPVEEGLDDWPDDRIWAELQDRLTARGRRAIEVGDLVERDILDLRVRVFEPMQHGRVFFAGDAAHLITPAGGKGMNIAIQDAAELAAGLHEQHGAPNDGGRLQRYSQTRLPHVWRQQEFSNLMLSLFSTHATASDPDGTTQAFSYGLGRARLDLIINDPQFARWFAYAYAGVDH